MMDPSHIAINAVILSVFLMLLDRSSYAVITGAADISRSTRIRYSSIGFIFVALSTSLPEASVSLFAAIEGAAGLAIGNVLGSNIANVCLIVGIPVLYGCLSKTGVAECRLTLPEQEYSSLFFGLFISSVLPLFMVRSTKYVPFIGVVLIAMFIIYSYHLSRSRTETCSSSDLPHGAKRILLKGVAWATAGIAGVILSGYAIVLSASNLAAAFSLSGTLIGATIVAVGTSLPELAISLKSIQKNRIDFALSNAIGSCFANLTIILGLFFVFSRITIRIDAYFDLVFFSLVSNLFLWYFLSRRKLGPKESIALLMIYAIFLVEFVGVFTLF
ncbi:MAG: sodium:calcium antiporter [Candidatus Bathyarchaeia archaeon]